MRLRLQVHPVVFNFWTAVGVIISSAGFIFHEKFVSECSPPEAFQLGNPLITWASYGALDESAFEISL